MPPEMIILDFSAFFVLLCISTMGTHVSFIFRGYNPYVGDVKPLFFMVLGSKGNLS